MASLCSNERGVVLSTALIFLVILGLVGSTAYVVTTTDIKIGGNYKTNIQAFYNAEAGVQDGISRLVSETITDSGSETDANWNTGSSYSTTNFSNSFSVSHYVVGGNVQTDSNGNPLYKISATGTSGNASKVIEVIVGLTYPSPFSSAMHGCDGVSVSSNATTDSYSSSGAPSSGDQGNIGTSNANANITLDSNTNINGDVSATGSLTLNGNARIQGDALANSGISLNGQNTVGGNANTNGNIFLDQSTIQGNANASGNIRLDHNSSAIQGNATAGGTITCKDNCGSDISGTAASGSDPYSGVTLVPTSDCDPLGLTTLFTSASSIAGTNNNSELSDIPGHSNYPYNTANSSFTMNSNDTYTLGASGSNKDYYFSGFSMNSNSVLTVQGDVTLYVNGNFSLNSNTIMSFATGASLTIYVTGSFSLDSNTQMNKMGTPSDLKIYSNAQSSSNSDYKVNLNSNSGFSGAIYAPKSAINVNSNSQLYGAVRGKFVNMNSNGAFHYDEDLQNLQSGGTPNGYAMVSWREVF